MATIEPTPFYEQAGVTGTSDVVLINTNNFVSVAAVNTAAGSCNVQFTFNTREQINAGTARWVNMESAAISASKGYLDMGLVAAVRLVASSGTWVLQVRQDVRY